MLPSALISPPATLAARYRQVRSATEALCAPLRPEDCVVQPVVDVSPPKWHMGHVTWFFEQFFLKDYLPGYQIFHPKYAYLFNSYYEGAGERVQRAYRGNMTRPSVQEVLEYRQYVDAHMARWLEAHPDPAPRARYILEIGLQHEEQHQELLHYDIKYILGHNPLFPAYREAEQPRLSGPAPAEMTFLEMEAGIYEIGHAGEGFCFDNELGRHRVFLEPYRVLDRLVTAGEYREFMEAGGYRDYRFWLEEGWKWVNMVQADAPKYWFPVEGEWQIFTLEGLRPLNPAEPVTHVNYYETQAFARWKGMRLPTEFEWEAACRRYAPEIPAAANFTDLGALHPIPRQSGDHQFFGDVWEWTQSAYLPYPRYHAEDSALGEYNGKFMVGQMVLRGGSCATPRGHIRATYRNFFHPHLQWLFSGFRLAADGLA
ncbi:MAG: ergothioneine biosynthesis protein EgtB [Bacteroidia bacterium]|nr:ergothioneine biosynthesis protein EgtB [Bacteroidia bacterium]